jgi:hypothetical protein
MGRRAPTAIFLCVALCGTTVWLNGAEPLTIRVSPAIARQPALLKVVARIEADGRNRSLEIVAQSDAFFTSSQVQLDNGDGQRVWNFEFRDLPQGKYEVTGTLTGSGGRVAEVRRLMMVIP